MKLNKLSLKHKTLFNRFLGREAHELSAYAFQNIYIWRGLFDIRWAIIRENLCVFFKDNNGCFMYLEPLGQNIDGALIDDAFRIMDGYNKNINYSRIENIEEKDLAVYKGLGLDCRLKSHDYVCSAADLTQLRGNKFKSKRWSYNFFSKHYRPQYLDFCLKHRRGCLKLYERWKRMRLKSNQDRVYCGMLEDSLKSLKVTLGNFKGLNLLGKVVKIDNEIKAFTFGFKLNPDTFCVLYEITDLSVKGLAQFIFRALSSELKGYKYLNIMDDSGLENLKQVKLSYRPEKLIPAYIARRYG